MLYSLSLSFIYQRDKEAVLLWIAGMIPQEKRIRISENDMKIKHIRLSREAAFTNHPIGHFRHLFS